MFEIFPLASVLLHESHIVSFPIALCFHLRQGKSIAKPSSSRFSRLESSSVKMHILYLSGWIIFKFLHKLSHSRLRPQVTYTISLFKTVQKLKLWTVFFLLVLSQIKPVLVEIINLKGIEINIKNSVARHSKIISG